MSKLKFECKEELATHCGNDVGDSPGQLKLSVVDSGWGINSSAQEAEMRVK